MRVILTGGGTGGHIYPAVAIAKRIRNAIPDADILYVGGNHGLEADIVKKEKLAFKGIYVKPFDRKSFWKRLKAYSILLFSFLQSFIILRKYKPNLVIGTGGYVSGPIVFLASLMKIDTIIHEQNAIPGLTTKFLAKRAKKVLISYKDSIPYFKKSNNVFYTGVPIREEFYKNDKAIARTKYNLKENDLLVVSLGGSNGAKLINELSKKLLSALDEKVNIHYIHVTGRRFYDDYWQGREPQLNNNRIRVLPYSDDMPNLLLAANLVISRAGALSLAEFKAVKLPAVLIPSPNVAANHQMLNAKAFERTGSALVADEKEYDTDQLLKMVLTLLDNPKQIENMHKNYGDDIEENALNTIISMIFKYGMK